MSNPPHEPARYVTLPSGFVYDRVAAVAHVMQPAHTRGVVSSRGPEEGIATFGPHRFKAGATLGFNTDGFVNALHAALADHTAGYVMQLRRHGRPLASAQVNWAKEPSDGSRAWGQDVRMHIASCSKLITAMAMTRTLAEHKLPASTKIINYLPTYWVKGPNIDKITFAQLLTHTSGFRVDGSDMSYPTMKELIERGVTAANHGVPSYQNTNFSLCRILLPIMNRTLAANATFPSFLEDQIWDHLTISAYATYIEQHVFRPAGVTGPTLTHPDPDALAYAFAPAAGWNSGDLATESGGAGWHMSVNELLNVMACFRRQGAILSPSAAQTMLDDGFGIDVKETTPLGTLYNKNGLWKSKDGQTEQSLAYFLPNDMELVVLANSPIGKTGRFFRDVVTQIILDNIQPEIAAGGWAARHDLTAERYQEAFNDYAGNHGMQLMNISGYGTTAPLYAALWVKTPSPPAWQARHGLTGEEYQLVFNQLTGEDYRPVLVNGYGTQAGPRFACIFHRAAQKDSVPWVARHNLTSTQYQAAFNEFTAIGYTLDWVSGYFDGTRDLYAAVWRKPRNAPTCLARHGLTSTEYQAFFNHVTEQGFKLTLVCGYSDGTRDRYAAIARSIPDAPPWQARHGLTPSQYQTTFDQLGASGYRLELVNGYSIKGQDRIAAIWTK